MGTTAQKTRKEIDAENGLHPRALIQYINFSGITVPSINQRYGINRKTGTMFLQADYRAFRDRIAASVHSRIDPPQRVQITWQTYHDIDNAIKAILDGLVAGGCIEDDRTVQELVVSKFPCRRGEKNTLDITVETIAG